MIFVFFAVLRYISHICTVRAIVAKLPQVAHRSLRNWSVVDWQINTVCKRKMWKDRHTWTVCQAADFSRCSEPFSREQDSSRHVTLYIEASLLAGQTRRTLTSPRWQLMRRTWRPVWIRSHLRERLPTSASMKGHCFRWLSRNYRPDLEGRLREGPISYTAEDKSIWILYRMLCNRCCWRLWTLCATSDDDRRTPPPPAPAGSTGTWARGSSARSTFYPEEETIT